MLHLVATDYEIQSLDTPTRVEYSGASRYLALWRHSSQNLPGKLDRSGLLGVVESETGIFGS